MAAAVFGRQALLQALEALHMAYSDDARDLSDPARKEFMRRTYAQLRMALGMMTSDWITVTDVQPHRLDLPRR